MAGDDIPHFVPNYFPPLLPALSAGMFYGIGVGIGTYLLVFILLVAMGWAFLAKGWPLRWLARARLALVIFAAFLPGLLNVEIVGG